MLTDPALSVRPSVRTSVNSKATLAANNLDAPNSPHSSAADSSFIVGPPRTPLTNRHLHSSSALLYGSRLQRQATSLHPSVGSFPSLVPSLSVSLYVIVCLSLSLSALSLSVCLCMCLPVSFSMFLSVSVSLCLSVPLCLFLSVSLSVSLRLSLSLVPVCLVSLCLAFLCLALLSISLYLYLSIQPLCPCESYTNFLHSLGLR